MRLEDSLQVHVLFPAVDDAVEEMIDLALEWVMADRAAVGQHGWELDPSGHARKFAAEEPVVTQTAVGAEHIDIELVGHPLLDRRRNLAGLAIGESHDG